MLKDDSHSQLEENPFAQYLEWAEHQNALVEQEGSDRESRARDILQRDKNLPHLISLQNKIQQAIEERDRLLKEAGYKKIMSYDDIHSWWRHKDLDFVQEDQMPPGGAFPTYY